MGKKEIDFILSIDPTAFNKGIKNAYKGFDTFDKSIQSSLNHSRALNNSLLGLPSKLAGLFGGVSAAAFTKSVFDAGLAFDNLQKSFQSITGSSAAARSELEYLKETSNQLGIEFQSAATAYRGLIAASQGTDIEGAATRDLFRAVSETAAAVGASGDEINRTFAQISQGISRGRFELEDLKTIAEALPGVGFQDFAKAVGTSTEELFGLISAGQIVSTDFIPKLSEVLHNKFGQAALDASNSAQAAINKFKNAWFDLATTVSKSGFLDTVTGKITDFTAALSDPNLQDKIVTLSNRFFTMAEAVLNAAVNHGELAVKLGLGSAALLTVHKAVVILTGAWQGLNAAMMAMTGMRLIRYLGSLNVALTGSGAAALTASAALGAAAGATLALIAGMAIGTKLYEWTEPTEIALRELQHELDITAAKFRQFAYFQPESKESLFAKSTTELRAYENQLIGAFKHQSAIVQDLYLKSKDRTIFGGMTNEARQAEVELAAARTRLEQIESAMNDYGEVAETAYNKVGTKAKQTADQEVQLGKEKLEKLKQQYQTYVSEITRLQDEIVNRERSLQEQLRSMSRTGMDDYSAWQDRKREAQEYETAAKKAAQSGDFSTAIKYADMAKTAYADLNNEVKVNDNTIISQQTALKTAMAGVEQAGKLATEILQQQKAAAEEAAQALDDQTGGKLAEEFGAISKEAEALKETATDFNKAWNKTWNDFLKGGSDSVDDLQQKLNDLVNRDYQINVKVQEVAAKATGGMVHKLRSGGKLSGYGGGDRIPALLEAGEFVIRKEAVRKYGAAYFQALNALQLNSMELLRARTGGLINNTMVLNPQGIQKFQQGGQATAAAQTGRQVVNNTVNLKVGGFMTSRADANNIARTVLKAINEFHWSGAR